MQSSRSLPVTAAGAHRRRQPPAPSAPAYLAATLTLLVLAAIAYSRAAFPRFPHPPATRRCRPDAEGSWSAGVFLGDSPFSLKPIEHWGISSGGGAAWPVANPVATCADVAGAGFPSSFVANPFLFIQGDAIYMFFETKDPVTSQGDIAAAISKDAGTTWQQLGVVLDEEWHLSYPYVFSYENKTYMMPESSKKGNLRLYYAVDFPRKWKLEKVLLERPLVDSVIINFQGSYWLLGSDISSYGSKQRGLCIWYSSSPLGPWNPHKQNPVRNNKDNKPSARNGGRPFIYNDSLYRIGKDCDVGGGCIIQVFKVEVLTAKRYKEVAVPFVLDESLKGRNAWNGARSHRLDIQQLPLGQLWIGVTDGDRVPSGDSIHRLTIGYMFYGVASVLVLLLGVLMGAIKCILPLRWYLPHTEKQSDTFNIEKQVFLCHKFSSLICFGTHYIFGGNGAEEPYLVKGTYSQFTLLTMTYDARKWNLKMFVEHYSKCASVREIVVVWNKGQPPSQGELKSMVPVNFPKILPFVCVMPLHLHPISKSIRNLTSFSIVSQSYTWSGSANYNYGYCPCSCNSVLKQLISLQIARGYLPDYLNLHNYIT